MVYTVGEMAKLLDIPASTLRYYDKEGLLLCGALLRWHSDVPGIGL